MRAVVINGYYSNSAGDYGELYLFSDELRNLYRYGLDDEDIAHRLDIPVEEIYKLRTNPDEYSIRRFKNFFTHRERTVLVRDSGYYGGDDCLFDC